MTARGVSLQHSLIQTSYAKTLIEYFFAFSLSVLCTILVLQLWKLQWLYIPFVYTGDANYFRGDWVYYAMTIKSTITTGWYLCDPSIGVPGGHFLGDFPTPEGLNYLIIKILSWFSSNWVLVFNLFFLLGFPLITLSSLFVFRRLKLSYPFALTASLLFTFLPFHLIRGEGHAFLSAYYIFPLAVWLALLLYQNSLFESETRKKKRLLLYCFICILIGSNGIYCAFFTAFFMLLAGLIAGCRGQWRPLKYGTLFIAIISASITLNIWPTIAYQMKNGPNPQAFHRSAIESEIYGLKIAQLLLPVDNDRIFAKLKHKYNTQSIPEYPFHSINENGTVTLGFIGSLGFLMLIGHIFFKRKNGSEDLLMDGLAHFNLSAFLLATIGGFSSLFAFFALTGIRCYNRISIFIGFFVLAAFFLFLQKRINNQKLIWGWSLCLLGLGLFNQSTTSDALPKKIKKIAKVYQADQAFFQTIEQTLSPGSRIFQLPYLPFPEGIAHRMFSYEHFKGPLHTNMLKWSFGAMHGRTTDLWQKQTSSLIVPEMLKELIEKGFTGLYIDRDGYADGGQAIEAHLSQLLKIMPHVDNHRSFWDLRELR